MQKAILIIEDDKLVAKSLKDLLNRCDFFVMIASNGEIALGLAKFNKFDLIISDIRMPGEVGTEVVKKVIQFQNKDIPFIFITGYSDELYVTEAERMGCSGFFLKPFDMNALLQKLETVLNVQISILDKPVIDGQLPPSRIKKLFYSALGSQWNPEKEIDWNGPLGIESSLRNPMAYILSPIVMGEYSAFNGLPQRILSFKDPEVKQYLAAQLVDETRHAEAFDLYLTRIGGQVACKKGLRNIYVLRFFNGLKKLEDNDQWITGLYLTEVLAHSLLKSYGEKIECPLTRHMFKMILSDEGRHISFSGYYLKEILKNTSKQDRDYMRKIVEHMLGLTKGMLYSYEKSYKAFSLDPGELFDEIHREINIRLTKSIIKTDES